jgi:uncharacterized protein (DUF433 family)
VVAGGSEVCFVQGRVSFTPPLVAWLRLPYTAAMSALERITVDQSVRFGKPCVRGTRITVGDVLSYLAAGMTAEQIVAEFSQLTREDIRACLAYAAERERRSVSLPAA